MSADLSLRILASAALTGLLACGEPATSVFVEVTFDDELALTQLSFSGTENGQVVFGELRPTTAGAPLTSPQSIRIRFSDDFDGRQVLFTANGMSEGRLVVTASASVTLAKGKELPVTLALSAPAGVPDAGTDAGSDAGVDGGVDAGTCAGCAGCCQDGVCFDMPSITTCGVDGGVCFACDVQRADSCAAGACRCGSNPPCGSGQACQGGSCVCNPTSCSGCCAGTTCLAGNEPGACGNSGATCASCGGAGCTDAGICDSCTPANCASGCCSGPACVTPPTLSACGASGGACTACDSIRANQCTSGGCRCGNGPPCNEGQHCTGTGTCLCDSVSCPNGCCQGVACQPGTAKSLCGTGGATCQACGLLSSCMNKACT